MPIGYLVSTTFVALCTLLALAPQRRPRALADTSVAGAISFYGYYGTLEESIPRSGPTAWDASAAPPFFVAHGDHDALVPVGSARRFVEHLRGTSAAPVVYAELPWAQHGFDVFHSLRYESVISATESFAAWVRSRALS